MNSYHVWQKRDISIKVWMVDAVDGEAAARAVLGGLRIEEMGALLHVQRAWPDGSFQGNADLTLERIG